MGALEHFKLKMEEQRRAKECRPTLNPQSIETAKDIGAIINTITRTATRTDLPDEFTSYCRQRYTAVVNSLNYYINDDILSFNKPSLQQLAETPLSVKDCQNDILTIIYEPEEKTVFVDKHKEENNLRIQKYVGMFQFSEKNCKLRFFRLTEELDSRSEDEQENINAKVLNTTWAVEPYFFTLPANFLDLAIAGEDYGPELNAVIEAGIPPDYELIALLGKYIEILKCVLYSIKTNLNRYCRLTQTLILRNTVGRNARMPISVLQLMDSDIEGLNDMGRAVHKQKPVKAKKPRKPRVKPKKSK